MININECKAHMYDIIGAIYQYSVNSYVID